MEIANKLVANLAAFLGLSAIIFGIILARWTFVNIQIQKLREELAYRVKEVELKDRELHDIRTEFLEIKKQQLHQERRIDADHEQLILKNAQLYAQEKYIERLEAGYRTRNEKLPKRPDGRVSWDDEG